ncbi:MAG: response regulator [Verrucomicrobia bacterium]|nr:response regulator [Verrucomicrobiota bacterium]
MTGSALPSPVIFLVDDDAGLLRLMEKTLRREGLATASAASGKAALDWLQQNTAALMLLDLKLPDIEGKELINHLATLNRSIPFIIITGQGDERVAADMMKRGALDYLVKDVRFIEFVPTVVRRALERLEKEKRLAAAEESQKRESAFNQAVFNTSGAALMVLDAKLCILRFNPACESLSEYTFDEVRGKPVWNFLAVSREIEAVKEMFGQLRDWAPALHSENHWRTKSGGERTIGWAHTAFRDAAGRLEFIICAGIDLTDRKRLEMEVLEISDREQRRIAQDLHDGLGQQLAGIACLCDALKQDMAAQKSPQAADATKVASLLTDAVGQTRRLARGLYPVENKPEGLMHALAELAERTTDIFRVDCQFLCPRPIRVENDSVATHLYRIAQEAVTNAIKHGKAKWIEIGLASSAQRIILAVRSDGTSYRKTPHPSAKGMGLRIMQYRSGLIGGSVLVQRRPEGGTEVICTLNRSPSAAKAKP